MLKRFTHFLTITFISFICLISIAYGGLPPSNTPGIQLYLYVDHSPTPFIIVEKATQKLMLFEQGESLTLINTWSCATGENPGTKSVSGDTKTPEGIYFITEIFQDNEITVFGSRAFHLNYPNIFDEYAGHNGDGIFIHGTNKTLIPYSSNGCITLNNRDLEQLAPYLAVDTVPVIIVEIMEEELKQQNFALTYGDSTYNTIMETLGLANQLIKPEQIEKLNFLKVGAQAMAWIRYDEYDANSLQYKYDKQVFLTPSPAKNWRTLYSTHKQDMIPDLLAIHPKKYKNNVVKETAAAPPPEVVTSPPPKVVAVPSPPKLAVSTITKGGTIIDFVEKWRKSWVEKDIKTYMSCYSDNFRSGTLNKNSWRQKKTYLNKKYEFIQVGIDNLVVERTDKKAKVSFFQKYKSDRYQTSGTKTLQLVMEDGKWMIEKEYML
jgi:murein L,D-transpeptidase YafK